MAVNLSPRQLNQGDIVGDVRRAIRDSGLDPATVVLEITESLMMTDADLAIKRLEEMKGLGVRLAMDDFGTGYSSLSYLSRFPVDILKMDRSFLEAESDADSGLAAAVVALGETLEHAGRRRGHRADHPDDVAAPARLRARPGLPVRAPDGHRVRLQLPRRRQGRQLRPAPAAACAGAQDEAQSDAA